jgi:hypothetical protein
MQICLGDGKTVCLRLANDTYYIEEGELTYETLLGLLGIQLGRSRLSVVEYAENLGDGMGRCRLSSNVVDAVADLMGEVLSGSRVRCGCEVCGPLWLIDLSLRVCIGEKVLLVEPGDLWQPTVEMLSRREVQAIVVVPGGQGARSVLNGEE